MHPQSITHPSPITHHHHHHHHYHPSEHRRASTIDHLLFNYPLSTLLALCTSTAANPGIPEHRRPIHPSGERGQNSHHFLLTLPFFFFFSFFFFNLFLLSPFSFFRPGLLFLLLTFLAYYLQSKAGLGL
ncbi:hypothetical protein F4809DRAFT_160637 [Biscogniauxia mediterranea]|nr:hypothetical protein F4809DRAFT_160637 [Biscogniauxia mediterranea]